ncbi:unnamed protein product [Rhizoctonia solani]|uniref:RlpA-like protein double-psi beta-barrel domain-containing protein n=1 Tax=Rhizoctonia solani TaxID=456999 RepID=A0A8H3DHW1_9AGAM|nr:unnamed protein product [Rhizoctonia solani]
MRSTQVLAVLAVLAASVSGMSIGHTSNQPAHRRHAVDVQASVIQARGARRAVLMEDMPDVVKRDNTVPRRRKRGLNQRRCSPKTTSALAETTSVVSTSSVAPSTTPEPESTTSKAKAEAVPTTSSKAEHTTSSKAEPTTSSKAKYTKTSQTSQTPTKTSTSAKPTATSDDSGSSSGDTYTGQATYYGTGLGSCGITSTDTDYIVAVSHLLYDGFDGYTGGNPNSNPVCGKKIKANYQGKSVTVTVVDRCTGCALRDLDFSPAAFSQLADQSLGRLDGMTWAFM